MKIFARARRDFFLPLLVGGMIGSIPSLSLAHSVVVWAETIADIVQVETFLSNGVAPKQGRVMVEDENGDVLIRGQLDDRGQFRFPTPATSALTVKVILSPGHEGSFRLRLDAVGSGNDLD